MYESHGNEPPNAYTHPPPNPVSSLKNLPDFIPCCLEGGEYWDWEKVIESVPAIVGVCKHFMQFSW